MNIGDESPALLDPIIPADTILLWFLDDGRATCRYEQARDPWSYSRVEKSIDVYNLNHVLIKEERVMKIDEVKRQVIRGEKYISQEGPAAAEHFTDAVRVLADLIAPDAEYARCARAILAGYRDKEWVQEILQAV
jgi:hypothetical protein